jgi:hypothetical protein
MDLSYTRAMVLKLAIVSHGALVFMVLYAPVSHGLPRYRWCCRCFMVLLGNAGCLSVPRRVVAADCR